MDHIYFRPGANDTRCGTIEVTAERDGGVLLGIFEVSRRIQYVVHDFPAPDDSHRKPSHFMRGPNGLAEKFAEIGELTKGLIG